MVWDYRAKGKETVSTICKSMSCFLTPGLFLVSLKDSFLNFEPRDSDSLYFSSSEVACSKYCVLFIISLSRKAIGHHSLLLVGR